MKWWDDLPEAYKPSVTFFGFVLLLLILAWMVQIGTERRVEQQAFAPYQGRVEVWTDPVTNCQTLVFPDEDFALPRIAGGTTIVCDPAMLEEFN